MPAPMTPEEFAELDGLFQEAVGLTGSRRRDFLDQVRRRSAALADRLDSLLEEDAGGADPLGSSVSDAAALVLATDDPLIGGRFGPYRIEKVIGRGGMGAVYLGLRDAGDFSQRVAIKTIPFGHETPGLLERFRREREILARLDHPGIARLVDGGTGPYGVPFVAMEYIEGMPLLEYVSRHGCGLQRRLELFRELCAAVDFVHRNLIVHRDLKPGNVLVDGEGRVKLLDFGIAKILDEFQEGEARTATQQRAMTPEYASPEQILGRPVTTATDIYALGVVLYELLTGQRPVPGDTTSPYALAQAIVERVPTAPSDALRRLPAREGERPGARARLVRQLRGDLDRIVLTALRKEPDRRYASVAAMAADLNNFVQGRPVSAQIDSWHYRLRKFVSRHPAATLAAVAFLVTVVVFTGLSQRQKRALAAERDRAVTAEKRAREEAASARATSDFLVKLFNTADPREPGNRGITAYDLLQAGIRDLETAQGIDPGVRADLHVNLGMALGNLGQTEQAIASLEKGVNEIDQVHGADSLEASDALHSLGDFLRQANRFDEAYDVLTRSLDIRRRRMGEDSYATADAINNLAILAVAMGKYRESDELQATSLSMIERIEGKDSVRLATPLNNMSLLKRRQGRLQEALTLAERARDLAAASTDQTAGLRARLQIARVTRDLGRVQEARAEFEDVHSALVPIFGPRHSLVLDTQREIGECAYLAGDYAEAGKIFADLERSMRDAVGERSASYAILMLHRGRLDRVLGDTAAAEARIRTALRIHLDLTGPRHFRIPVLRRNLAEVLIDEGKPAEAERELREALAVLPEAADYPYLVRARVLTTLARALRSEGRPDGVPAALDEARGIVETTVGPDSVAMGEILLQEGLADVAGGRREAGRSSLEQAGKILRARLPPRHPDLLALR